MHIVADENIPLLDEFFAAFGSIRRLPGRSITAADVRDAVAFNEEVLRSHKLFPLSSIGLEKMVDGRDCYTMFGALSSSSTLSDVVFEIELLEVLTRDD